MPFRDICPSPHGPRCAKTALRSRSLAEASSVRLLIGNQRIELVSWRGKTRSSPQPTPVMSMRRRCTKWRASRSRVLPDSGTLNRVAEVACGFDARGCVPSRLYTKAAPITRRNFDHRCKRTFAIVSAHRDISWQRSNSVAFGAKRTSTGWTCLSSRLRNFLSP
jgi:hypothetical protein